jgi:chemotaxis protein histidine kinase CheA
MSDRLQKLLRQRALIREHLEWLNREIAENQEIPPLPASVAQPTQVVAAPSPSAINQSDEAEKILGQFQKNTGELQTETRRGCLFIFSIAMGLFVLSVIVAYYFYARHLGRAW